MSRRQWITVVFVLVALPALMGSLPSGIENTIRGWFGSSGKLVNLEFSPSANTVSRTGFCKWRMNTSSKVMQVSCNGSAYTNLVGTGTISCSDDGAGNLNCNSFTSNDQDPNNVVRVFRNTTGSTCATIGVANKLTLFDKASSTNLWCLCDGTTQLFCFPSSGASTAADDTVLTGTAAEAASWKSIPDCDDTGGQHLNYDQTTNAWSCGTS